MLRKSASCEVVGELRTRTPALTDMPGLGFFPCRENGDEERPGTGGMELERKGTVVTAVLAHPGFGTMSSLT